MTPDDRAGLAVRLFALNKAMRDLREHIEAAAMIAKDNGATGVAFATHHLSDSISAYMTAVNRYVTGVLDDEEDD